MICVTDLVFVVRLGKLVDLFCSLVAHKCIVNLFLAAAGISKCGSFV